MCGSRFGVRIPHLPYLREVALGFRDMALTVFDPDHRIRGIPVKTLDG